MGPYRNKILKTMIENKDDWKDQSQDHNENRCLDAMSLVNTFCVMVTNYKQAYIGQGELFDKVMSLYKDCDDYGFVHDKKKTQV